MLTKNNNLFQQTKRRIFGELLQEAKVKTPTSWVEVHHSSKDLLFTYESAGLVMSLNGGGSIDAQHPDVQQAEQLVTAIVNQGGIVIDGGKQSGVMAAAKAAVGKSVGVIFPEIRAEARPGTQVIVNSPTPRVELLATCAPVIVIFRGGLGTFQVLMRAIVHITNRRYHPEQLAQLVFVNDYWIGLLSTMVNLGTIPQNFITELHFFHAVSQIIDQLPSAPKQKKNP